MEYFLTFSEGLFAFLSPCILPMLPLFLAYICADKNNGYAKRFINTLFFTAGFTFAFTAMGLSAFGVGKLLSGYKDFLIRLGGVIMVAAGFIYLDFIHVNLPGLSKKPKTGDAFSNFLFGIAYSFGWTPCLGAFLGSALSLAGVQSTAVKGRGLLICFSLGLSLPFMIFALGYEKLSGTFDFLKRHSGKIKLAGGVMLIAVGISMVFGIFGQFVAMFS